MTSFKLSASKLMHVALAATMITSLTGCSESLTKFEQNVKQHAATEVAVQRTKYLADGQPIKSLCATFTEDEILYVATRFSPSSLSVISETIGKTPKAKCEKLKDAIVLLNGVSDPLVTIHSYHSQIYGTNVGGERTVLLSAVIAP